MGNNRESYVINIRKVLKNYLITKKGTEPQARNQLVICVNQRMAFVYWLNDNVNKIKVIEKLKEDNRIELVSWIEQEKFHVVSGDKDGKCTFWHGGNYSDIYDQTWGFVGNEKLLDPTIKNRGISYGDFHDAFRYLSSSLNSHKGNYLVIIAKPGYEFKEGVSPTHVRAAAHGSLHKQES